MNFTENRLIKEFLNEKNNHEIYQKYLNDPSETNKTILNKRFKEFYFRIKAISYLVKTIHFESQRLDKQIRKHRQRFQPILDQPNENNLTPAELLESPSTVEEAESKNIEDYVTNRELYSSIKKLTPKQREILFYLYVKLLNDSEIAKILGVSQQSVTKTKNIALNKLRGDLRC